VILDLIQDYYTEPRVVNVTKDRMTGETEEVGINQMDEETGELLNDLTLGEYDVVVTSTPVRETLEDSQFQQAVQLRELGLPIPDATLLENSRLLHKSDIARQMEEQKNSPQAQQAQELQNLMQQLETVKLKGEAAKLEADAQLKQAQAQQAAQGDNGGELAKMQAEMQMAQEKHQLEMEKMAKEFEFKERELQLKERELEMKLQTQQQMDQQKLQAQKVKDFYAAQQPNQTGESE
jgi:hypothetical protein